MELFVIFDVLIKNEYRDSKKTSILKPAN